MGNKSSSETPTSLRLRRRSSAMIAGFQHRVSSSHALVSSLLKRSATTTYAEQGSSCPPELLTDLHTKLIQISWRCITVLAPQTPVSPGYAILNHLFLMNPTVRSIFCDANEAAHPLDQPVGHPETPTAARRQITSHFNTYKIPSLKNRQLSSSSNDSHGGSHKAHKHSLSMQALQKTCEKDATYLRHICRISDAIDYAVKNIHQIDDKVAPLFVAFGKQHRAILPSFQIEFVKDFGASVLEYVVRSISIDTVLCLFQRSLIAYSQTNVNDDLQLASASVEANLMGNLNNEELIMLTADAWKIFLLYIQDKWSEGDSDDGPMIQTQVSTDNLRKFEKSLSKNKQLPKKSVTFHT